MVVVVFRFFLAVSVRAGLNTEHLTGRYDHWAALLPPGHAFPVFDGTKGGGFIYVGFGRFLDGDMRSVRWGK